MVKFNEETNYIKDLDKNDCIRWGNYLQALLTTEEYNKLYNDYLVIADKDSPYFEDEFYLFCFKNIDVTYKKKDKILDYLEEKRRILNAMNQTSLHPCEGFKPAILIDEIEEFIKKN